MNWSQYVTCKHEVIKRKIRLVDIEHGQEVQSRMGVFAQHLRYPTDMLGVVTQIWSHLVVGFKWLVKLLIVSIICGMSVWTLFKEESEKS